MNGGKYILNWDGVLVNQECKIEKAYSDEFYSAKLICPSCKSEKITQFYVCSNCGGQYCRGELNLKKDKTTGLIYNDNLLKEYLKNKVEKKIDVKEVIDVKELIYYIEYLQDVYEISIENDKILSRIWKYLMQNEKGLLCLFGWRDREAGGIIIAGATKKLLLIMLRDYRLIKHANTEANVIYNNSLTEKLNAYSENTKVNLINEFFEKIIKGEEIKVEIKEEKKEEAKVIADWLLKDVEEIEVVK